MLFDAIVLAGGRSSRLEGTPKAQLLVGGRTLLRRTLDAVTDARRVVVVGPQPGSPSAGWVRFVREDPPFGGPAAAMAAGLAELAGLAAQRGGPTPPSHAPFTLVLACDMPNIRAALPALFAAIEGNPRAGGAIAVDRGREQPLAAIYATAALTDAVGRLARAGSLAGRGVFQLVAGLDLVRAEVTPGATDDVDTWADAARLGAQAPH